MQYVQSHLHCGTVSLDYCMMHYCVYMIRQSAVQRTRRENFSTSSPCGVPYPSTPVHKLKKKKGEKISLHPFTFTVENHLSPPQRQKPFTRITAPPHICAGKNTAELFSGTRGFRSSPPIAATSAFLAPFFMT
jgi:hypothetical protein